METSAVHFKRTTVKDWKRKIFNPQKEVGEPPEKFNKKGRPSLVGEELPLKVKEAIIGIRITEAVISRKMVISSGNGVLRQMTQTAFQNLVVELR